VAAEKLQRIDCNSYWEEKYSLAVGEGVQAPMYLLIPKAEPPYTAVLAFHGHDPGVQYILGNYPDEDTAVFNQNMHNNYAQALAQAGYLVCAIEQRGMGERLTEQTGEPPLVRSCRHLAFSYMLHGRTLLGERCWDGMCALNYLQTRADVRPGLFGCTGHSGGGTTALFLAAVDQRLAAAVVSGCFCSIQASILGMPHCECNYVPGILQLGEMGDIAALIAPRPLCLVNGRYDPIFPLEGAQAQFETVRCAYEADGRAEACQLTIHEGKHAYHLPTALNWFQTWLNEA
jgi:dienelactone hydrolase